MKLSASFKRIICAALGLFLVCCTCACAYLSYVEHGFRNNGSESYVLCAYRSDSRRINIENVDITFYYGIVRDVKPDLSHLIDGYVVARVSPVGKDDTEREPIFYRQINFEDFIRTEDYAISITKSMFDKHGFSHSERINLPQEVFTSDIDHIKFSIRLVGYALTEDGMKIEEESWDAINLYFKVNGQQVELIEGH